MEFAFTDEQEMLREQARSLLAREFPPERIVELSSSGAGWDDTSWQKIAEVGWTGLSIPEEHGGSGMSFLDEAVLFEELGYALYPGPYFSTIALALPALASEPDFLAAIAAGATTATVAIAEPGGPSLLEEAEAVRTEARETGGRWLVTGAKELVCDLGIASHIVVVARSR